MGFLVVVFGVVFAVHYYLYRRLIRSTTLPGRARRALTGGLVVLLGLLLVALVGSRVSSSWIVHVLAWPGFIWVAIMFYLTLICLVLEIPRLILNRRFKGDPVKEAPPAKVIPATVGSASGLKKIEIQVEDVVEPPERPDRRLFINRATAVAAGVGAGTIVGFGLKTGLGAPVIEKVRISLPDFAGGMRVALVSDIHLGPLTGIGHTERIVELINTLKADFVAIVGDLVDGPVGELGPLAAPLQHIAPPAYFVTGNHEYYLADGPEPWIDLLGEHGIKTLANERVTIYGRHGNLTLAGVNDVTGDTVRDGPDVELALHGRPEGLPTILLAHQPVVGLEAAKAGVDLQLSGHTHGGQMVPFDRIVPLQQPVVRGLGRIGDMPIYVTRGAGFWGPPVRVGAPPEITLIELT